MSADEGNQAIKVKIEHDIGLGCLLAIGMVALASYYLLEAVL